MRVRACLSAVALLAGAGAIVFGCSSANSGSGFGEGSQGGSSGSGGSGGLFNTDGGNLGVDSGILTGTPPCDNADPNADNDHDGFTPAQGDCNDCTDQMNPGAYDYPGNGVDEDCNGTPDDEATSCDQVPVGSGSSAIDAARALGICRMQQGASWGIVSAKWVFPDGTTASQSDPFDPFGSCPAGAPSNPQSHAIVNAWGSAVKPREGSTMVALSSGVALPGQQQVNSPGSGTSPDGGQMCTMSQTPPGFPKDSPACPGVQTANDHTAHDGAALEITLKAPTNAHSIAFDFDFYTYEFPVYVCTQYNDFFVALLDSKNSQTPPDKNISFDSQNNPVSVNNAFVQVCQAQNANGKNFPCQLGTGELNGTGFETHAATSWLQTKAAIDAGETFTLRFAIWDMGDEVLDSTVLVDNFRWDVEQGKAPVTVPQPH